MTNTSISNASLPFTIKQERHKVKKVPVGRLFFGHLSKNSMKKELNFFAKTQFFAETQSKFGQKLKIPRILANIIVNDYYTTGTFQSRA